MEPGLWDRDMVTNVLGRKRDIKNFFQKPGLWDCGMAIYIQVHNAF